MGPKYTQLSKRPSINLYCAHCDAHVGIFENKWQRLTSSYARPTEKGIAFGTAVSEKIQVVPHGPTQRAAEGCLMAEVVCRSCSTMVGQLCKEASEPDKKHLVDQRFYKLSRVSLRNAQTSEQLDAIFEDALPSKTDRAATSTSALPSSEKSSRPELHNSAKGGKSQIEHEETVLRKKSEQVAKTPLAQEMHRSPSSDTYVQSSASVSDQNTLLQFSHPNASQEQSRSTPCIQLRHGDLYGPSHGNADCIARVNAMDGRLTTESIRLNSVESRLAYAEQECRRHNSTVDDHARSMKLLDVDLTGLRGRYRQTDEALERQQSVIKDQQAQINILTERLSRVEEKFAEFQRLTTEQSAERSNSMGSASDQTRLLQKLDSMLCMFKSSQGPEEEVRTLREENEKMKLILGSGPSTTGQTIGIASGPQHSPQILGKRKRGIASNIESPQGMAVAQRQCQDHGRSQVIGGSGSVQPVSRRKACSSGRRNSFEQHHAGHFPSRNEDDSGCWVDSGSEDHSGQDGHAPAPGSGEAEDVERSGHHEMQSPDMNNGRGITTTRYMDSQVVNDLTRLKTANESTASFTSALQSKPSSYQGIYPGPSVSSDPRQYPSQYRPFLNAPGPVSAFFNPQIFPSGHIVLPQYIHTITSGDGEQPLITSGSGTFSGAIMQGQMLEDVIQQQPRATPMRHIGINSKRVSSQPNGLVHTANSNRSGKPLGRSTSEVNGASHQRSLTIQPSEASPAERVPNSRDCDEAALEFSDDDEEGSSTPITTSKPAASSARTTPVPPNGTLISRTIQGFALEPLRRPILNVPAPVPDHKHAKRRANIGGRPLVMPEFMAAITNLNKMTSSTKGSSLRGASPRSKSRKESLKQRGSDINAAIVINLDEVSEQMTRVETDECSPIGQPVLSKSNGASNGQAGTPVSRARPALGKEKTVVDAGHNLQIENDDDCAACHKRGSLLCCDGCPRSYHRRCLKPPIGPRELLKDDWFCPECLTAEKVVGAGSDQVTPEQSSQSQLFKERNKLAQATMDGSV